MRKIRISFKNKHAYNKAVDILIKKMPMADYVFTKNNKIDFTCYGVVLRLKDYLIEQEVTPNIEIIGNNDYKIILKKEIKKIYFDSNSYNEKFVNNLINSDFQILNSYRKAYQEVDKIRASNLLQKPEIWEIYFKKLKHKKHKSKSDERLLAAYNEFKDNFILSPFEAYIYYVMQHKESKTAITSIMGVDSNKVLTVLAFLYNFMEKLERVQFMSNTRARIIEEIEQIELTGSHKTEIINNFEKIKRMLLKNNISIEEIIREEETIVE